MRFKYVHVFPHIIMHIHIPSLSPSHTLHTHTHPHTLHTFFHTHTYTITHLLHIYSHTQSHTQTHTISYVTYVHSHLLKLQDYPCILCQCPPSHSWPLPSSLMEFPGLYLGLFLNSVSTRKKVYVAAAARTLSPHF